MPRVSVIIPTYNRVDVLRRAIDSVLAQTEEDFELLVVDDGSTDDTQAFLKTYDDPRVRSICFGTNRGANVARNAGIEDANGTYVAFLDSDDEWHPQKLERQLALLDERSDDWVAAYCDFEIRVPGVSGRTQMLGARVISTVRSRRTTEGGEELMGEILADNVQPGAGSTLLVRTDVARRVGGFNEQLDRFQDPEFVLRILEEGKVAHVDKSLVIRHETGSPDASVVEGADDQYLSSFSNTVDRLEAEGYDIRGSHNLVLAKSHLEEGKFRHGVRYLRDASVPPSHVPGVVWSAGAGVRQRSRSLVLIVGLVLLVLFVWFSIKS